MEEPNLEVGENIPEKHFLQNFIEKYKNVIDIKFDREHLLLYAGIVALAISTIIFLNFLDYFEEENQKEEESIASNESKESNEPGESSEPSGSNESDESGESSESNEVLKSSNPQKKGKKGIKLTEEWKKKEWNKWKKELEESSILFCSDLEKEKNIWLEEKDEKWKEWIKNLEEKWNNFDKYMKNEFYINILKESSSWTDEDWTEWIQTQGKQCMEKDWENYMSENESYLEVMTVKKWIHWKNNKIMEWIMREWKCEEDEFWEKWERVEWHKWLHLNQRRKWLQWKERLDRETNEWVDWIKKKEKTYIYNDCNKISLWKKEKYVVFNKWMESFISQCIAQKKWKTWVQNAHSAKSDKGETPISE
ncbi:tryptophan-rich protein [Plasmodium ovale]|uniref:Tryptophan-rich protein n=1 Tax=Plasmodium ovale TaxID=36330 RepID=A0A1D3JFU3_PLAOA|nr:tryptophan-rich protein [Plasmodium ovale]